MCRGLLLAWCLALAGCGGETTGRVGVTDTAPPPQPVELELRTHDGVPVFVGDLRGRPVLLFLFATFDGVSQAALRPLSRFVRHHPEVHVVGIAVQPHPEELVAAWAYALSPPFTVTFDPRDRVSTGTSDLGTVDTVPTFIVLGADGMEVSRHEGWASESKLDRLVEGLRVTEDAASPPPLLAE